METQRRFTINTGNLPATHAAKPTLNVISYIPLPIFGTSDIGDMWSGQPQYTITQNCIPETVTTFLQLKDIIFTKNVFPLFNEINEYLLIVYIIYIGDKSFVNFLQFI